MKRYPILMLLVGFCFVNGILSAAPVRTGVGLILFEPSGLTGKTWLGRSTALAGAVGWSGEKGNHLHLSADFLFFRRQLEGDRNLSLDLYIGLGGKIIFRDFDQAWVRCPVGLDVLLRRSPLNFFIELVPNFNFHELKLFGAVGFRYLFGE